MIRTNWHTHTKRCGHAVGEDEEYVLAAIQGGLKTLGFSDHAAYPKPQPYERMDISEVPGYIASIRPCRKKIKIRSVFISAWKLSITQISGKRSVNTAAVWII
ncbi:MAG: hypothetical protein IJH14_02320 [Solobacterium sp.]|nr:hypothetical protein [Solobacterium sp.]